MKSRIALTLLTLCCASAPAFAQNFDLDARRIAIGGTGNGDNPAQGMVPHDPSYHAIVLPFGLYQVWRDRNVFDPNSSAYNPVLAMEYAASPLHFILNRAAGDTSGPFVNDMANGVLSTDLNTYRGFLFPASLTGAGLLSPHWGGTIKGHTGRDGSFQGLYLGVGPYISVDTNLTADQNLVTLLASATNMSLPNTSFGIANATNDQLAGAITAGYRARIALAGSKAGSRDGVYLAANYNYLHGFRYDHYATTVRLDTGPTGLIVPTSTIVADHTAATTGSGYAIDLGASVVVDGWDFGFGASGIGNRIDWSDFTRDTYTLVNLVTGGDFVHTIATPALTTERITLPVRTTGNVGYTSGHVSVEAELSHGLQGTAFNGGLEYRMKAIALRGGGRYVKSQWHGSAGVGVNMSPRVALDLAAYGTSANLEQREKLALAVSLRINGRRK